MQRLPHRVPLAMPPFPPIIIIIKVIVDNGFLQSKGSNHRQNHCQGWPTQQPLRAGQITAFCASIPPIVIVFLADRWVYCHFARAFKLESNIFVFTVNNDYEITNCVLKIRHGGQKPFHQF